MAVCVLVVNSFDHPQVLHFFAFLPPRNITHFINEARSSSVDYVLRNFESRGSSQTPRYLILVRLKRTRLKGTGNTGTRFQLPRRSLSGIEITGSRELKLATSGNSPSAD